MDSHDSLARKKSSMRRTPTNASQGSESLQRKRNSIQFEEPPKEGEDDEPIPVIRYRNSIVRNYDGQINNSKKSTIHNDEPSGFGFDLEKAISLENFDVTNSIKDKLANSLSTPVKPLNFALLGVQRNLSSPLLSPTYEFKMTHEKNVDEGDDSNSDEKSSDEDDNVRKTEPLKGSESKKASFNELPKIQASAFDNESPPSASPTRQGTMTLGRSLSKSIKKVMSKSSLASSHASSVTVIARLQELIWQKYLDFLDLPLILRAIDFLESCQIKILLWSLVNICSVVAVILIVFLVEDHKQNDIEIYNLAHLAFGFLGHIIVLGAFELQNEVATAIVGHQLLKGTAELSLVSMPRSSRIPSSNRKMRFLVQFTAILFDVAIILMCLYLNWTPEFSALPGLNKTGLYPCIPASYPESFKLPPFDLGTFLQGDVDYATIYHYGLPLKDGILGGFGAWPLYSPKEAKVFKVEAKGYIFAINVVCGKPTFVNKKIFNQTIDGTFFKTGSQVEMPNSFFSVVYVAYPAFSHNWVGYEDQPMQQACNIQLSSGGGRITTEMVVDEWEMIVLGKISNITVIDTDGSSKTAILDFHHKDTAESSDMMYAAEFEDAFFYSPSSPDYENIQTSINQVMNGAYYSSQGASFSNIQSWGTLPDGIYHVENTWKGLAAALGVSAKFVLMQYDGTKTSSCLYEANIGSGIITSVKIFTTLILAIGGFLCFLLFYQFLWWKISFTTTREVDLACQTLNLPLRLILESNKDSAEWVRKNSPMSSCSETRILNNYSKTFLKFGELRETRKDNIGTLAIVSDPKKIVHLVKDRKYI